MRGAQSPPFLGQPSALLAFSSRICFPSGLGEGGKVSSISQSGKGAAASLRSPASPCGSRQQQQQRRWSVRARVWLCVCLCNESPRHCLLPSLLPCLPDGAFHLGCCLLSGLLPRREEEEEEEGLLAVMKARPRRAAHFRHPAFPFSLSLRSFGCGCRQEHLKVPFCAALGSPGSILRHHPACQPAPSRPPGTPGGCSQHRLSWHVFASLRSARGSGR